jgi:hypothetical protein
MKRTGKYATWAALAAVLAIAGCDKDNSTTPPEKLGDEKYLVIPVPDAWTTMLTHLTSNITSGALSVTNAKEGEIKPFDVKYIGGALYGIDPIAGKFMKYGITDKGLVEKGGIAMPATEQYSFIDLGNGRIFLFLEGYFEDGRFPYYVVDASSFTLEKSGTIEVPVLPGLAVWPNSAIVKEGKIYFDYMQADKESYVSNDTAYVSVYDMNTLAYEKTLKDPRTSCLGYNQDDDHMFDADGNLYLSSSNTDFWGINEKLPAGILRIKKGSTEFDRDYFFDVSALVGGNHFLAMLPISDSKAVIKVFRKDLIKEFSDFYESFTVEHYVVDMIAKTAVKLDVPIAKGIDGHYADMGKGKFAIPVNTKDGNFIYILDAATLSVTKGAEYQGAAISQLIGLQ